MTGQTVATALPAIIPTFTEAGFHFYHVEQFSPSVAKHFTDFPNKKAPPAESGTGLKENVLRNQVRISTFAVSAMVVPAPEPPRALRRTNCFV